MRCAIMPALLLALVAGVLPAQGVPGPRAQVLRERIERRFAERVQAELRLTPDQARQLRETTAEYGGRRRELQERERVSRRALAVALRGGAADQDRVDALTKDLLDLRVEHAQLLRSEMDALGEFLTPEQRARFFALREVLRRRAEELRERRFAPRR